MTDSNNEHGHDDHGGGHAPFIAHHFDNARQQFDAGKLGIWVFLLTEILFFSGLFCAYVLYRSSNPEIFYEAHFQLDKVLGGANTIVLLFSSLTMAIAVRASQLGQKNVVIFNLAITMVCAAIFLGVKAVEYSHKWDEGILTRGYFSFDPSSHHTVETVMGISKYLFMLSIIPAILLVGFSCIGVLYKFTNAPKKAQFFMYLAIMMAGYFLGAVAGQVYMDVKPVAKDGHGASSHGETHVDVGHDETGHDETGHDETGHDETGHDEKSHENGADSEGGDVEKSDDGSKDEPSEIDAEKSSASVAAADSNAGDGPEAELTEKQRRVGIFFSIYYCMTGLHAVHVIGGMIALSWLLWRSINAHWRPDYYGPVDYVGLYWHLVDLIWIFLFPLLYLIK